MDIHTHLLSSKFIVATDGQSRDKAVAQMGAIAIRTCFAGDIMSALCRTSTLKLRYTYVQ